MAFRVTNTHCILLFVGRAAFKTIRIRVIFATTVIGTIKKIHFI